MSEDTVYALSEADSALGHLQGLGRVIKNPQLLVGPYLRREALASSRIEGTEASLSDVLQAEASEPNGRSNGDVDEVERYLKATHLGFTLLETVPLTQRILKATHQELLRGGPEEHREYKMPGEIRQTPVWIGSPTDSPDTALFVPPLPDDIPDLLADWERFVNEPSRLPVLIRCALMHYQFETIHPFSGGNGRIGRLAIGLMLIQERRLTTPLLYLSGYLEAHRRDYYSTLQAVREEGDIGGWLQFILTAVTSSAADAVTRAGQLISLRETYALEGRGSRSNIGGLLDLIFAVPYVTVARVECALKLTNQGARGMIRDAESRGWLTKVGTSGRGGRIWWVADAVFDIIDAPVSHQEP